ARVASRKPDRSIQTEIGSTRKRSCALTVKRVSTTTIAAPTPLRMIAPTRRPGTALRPTPASTATTLRPATSVQAAPATRTALRSIAQPASCRTTRNRSVARAAPASAEIRSLRGPSGPVVECLAAAACAIPAPLQQHDEPAGQKAQAEDRENRRPDRVAEIQARDEPRDACPHVRKGQPLVKPLVQPDASHPRIAPCASVDCVRHQRSRGREMMLLLQRPRK